MRRTREFLRRHDDGQRADRIAGDKTLMRTQMARAGRKRPCGVAIQAVEQLAVGRMAFSRSMARPRYSTRSRRVVAVGDCNDPACWRDRWSIDRHGAAIDRRPRRFPRSLSDCRRPTTAPGSAYARRRHARRRPRRVPLPPVRNSVLSANLPVRYFGTSSRRHSAIAFSMALHSSVTGFLPIPVVRQLSIMGEGAPVDRPGGIDVVVDAGRNHVADEKSGSLRLAAGRRAIGRASARRWRRTRRSGQFAR